MSFESKYEIHYALFQEAKFCLVRDHQINKPNKYRGLSNLNMWCWNGDRAVAFAIVDCLIVTSTRFQHRQRNLLTWSPKTAGQATKSTAALCVAVEHHRSRTAGCTVAALTESQMARNTLDRALITFHPFVYQENGLKSRVDRSQLTYNGTFWVPSLIISSALAANHRDERWAETKQTIVSALLE